MFSGPSVAQPSLKCIFESIRVHGLYFIVFLMLGTNLASATAADGSAPDSPVPVDGVVKDTSGALVPGAHIRFNSATGAPVEVVADEEGAFQTRLPAGHYLLSAIQTGFEQEEEPLDVSGEIPAHLCLPSKFVELWKASPSLRRLDMRQLQQQLPVESRRAFWIPHNRFIPLRSSHLKTAG